MTHGESPEGSQGVARSNVSGIVSGLIEPRSGLPNQTAFYDRLSRELARSESENVSLTIMMVDVDDVERVLIARGVAARDRLMAAAGERLAETGKTATGAPITVYQARTSRYAIILGRGLDHRAAHELGVRFRAAMHAPFDVDGTPLRLDATIGIARYPNHGADPYGLGRACAVALHMAKSTGAGWAIYDQEWDREQQQAFTLINDFRAALECTEQLSLAYQPKIALEPGKCTGVEALLRWRHPANGPQNPGYFIPKLEGTGLLEPLTEFVLSQALTDQQKLDESGERLSMAVNLSPSSLGDGEFLHRLGDIIRFYSVEPQRIEFEVTENALMASSHTVIDGLARLREMGPRVVVDDFGTGYSSLAYLTDLAIDGLKIDKSFLLRAKTKPQNLAIIKAASSLGQELGLEVTVEGAETREDYENLRIWECDAAQGYYMARPMPFEDLQTWLAESGYR